MLPPETVNRLFQERDILGLIFRDANRASMFLLRVLSSELPNNLPEFSLGSANALNTSGTGWRTIEDANGDEFLEPDNSQILYQVFYGISPSYAWVYRQYPSGVDRGSLNGTRSVGDREGFIDGRQSPIDYPSALTELVTFQGQHPAFNGYHPYAVPSSINIFMSFHVATYGVEVVTEDEFRALEAQEPSWRERVRRISVGGRSLMSAPSWISAAGFSLPATVPGY